MDSDTILREARLIKNLKHSHIPVIYDIEEDDHLFFFFEDFIEGLSIDTFVSYH